MSFYRDIAYREPYSDRENKCSRLLNIFTPDTIGPHPVMLFFHGGGLETGCYQDLTPEAAAYFTQKGITVVSADYRMYPAAGWPDFVHDAAAACQWVFRNISSYQGSKHNIFLAGHSAGAYLAAITGLDPKYLQQQQVPATALRGIISLCGQLFTHFRVKKEKGISELKPVIDAAAPIYHLTRQSPPVLSVCAEDDMPARAAENIFFIEVLKSYGHKDNQYFEIKGHDHTGVFEALGSNDDQTSRAVTAFIRKYHNKNIT